MKCPRRRTLSQRDPAGASTDRQSSDGESETVEVRFAHSALHFSHSDLRGDTGPTERIPKAAKLAAIGCGYRSHMTTSSPEADRNCVLAGGIEAERQLGISCMRRHEDCEC